MRNINVECKILTLFYKSVIKSVLYFLLNVWFDFLTGQDKAKLKKIIKTCGMLKADIKPKDERYKTNV